MRYPKTNRGWAGYVARRQGLSGNRRFEAAFEGGWNGYPANADRVVEHLRTMVANDVDLADAVLRHHNADKSGVVGLPEIASETMQRWESTISERLHDLMMKRETQ